MFPNYASCVDWLSNSLIISSDNSVAICLNVANGFTYYLQDFQLQGGKLCYGGPYLLGEGVIGYAVLAQTAGNPVQVAAYLSILGCKFPNSRKQFIIDWGNGNDRSARLYCSALRLSPTMASADFSQFVVTTANESACETSRDKPVFFPRLPSRFTPMGYGYL